MRTRLMCALPAQPQYRAPHLLGRVQVAQRQEAQAGRGREGTQEGARQVLQAAGQCQQPHLRLQVVIMGRRAGSDALISA